MPGIEWLPEGILKLINSNWGATIIGWILGGLSAWLATRRQARMQAETIRTLSAALAKFEDNFKQHLEPLTDPEKDQLAKARDAFIFRDHQPSKQRIFWRTAKFPAIWSAATAVLWFGFFVSARAVSPLPIEDVVLRFAVLALLGVSVISFLITIGSLIVFKTLYWDEHAKIATERLNEAQSVIQSLRLNERQFDHLRRWALGHTFLFFGKTSALRRIELASINTRQTANAAALTARAGAQLTPAPAAEAA